MLSYNNAGELFNLRLAFLVFLFMISDAYKRHSSDERAYHG